MQEAELKEKEKRRISEEEKKQKEEGIKAETREAITIWRGKQERPAGVVSPAIPSLQTRPFKGIKTKIEAFSTEIREIKPIKREIQKISIKTRLFRAINRRIFAFNTTIPTLEQRIINLAVPVLAPKHFHESKARNIHLNLELPKIRALPRIISVPRIGVKSFSEVKAKERTFVSGVIERGKGKEEVKEIEVTSEKEETGEVGEGLLDALFAPIEKEHDLKGVLHAFSERPIIILAEKSEDDYIDALKLILREIYRIKVGGFPKVRVTKKEKDEVEDVKAEHRIHIIDDDLEDKFFGFFKLSEVEDLNKVVDMDKLLGERMNELFAQGFGFLVFYLKKEKFDFLRNSFGTIEHKIQKIILTKGKKLKEDEREKISSVSWGFLEPKESWRSLGDYFIGYEKEFYNELEKLSGSKYAISVRESIEDEEEGKESNLHYLLKIFLVKYLREKLKIEKEVETEVKMEEIVPDIFVPGEDLAIEVETLYGTGIATLRRLGRTIEKYEGKGHKLWVLIPNLQLLLFQKDVREVIKTFTDKVELKFFGIDLNKQELIPLDELKKKLKG